MSKYTLTYRKGRSQEIYIEEVKKGNDYVPYFEQEYDEARKLIKEIIDSQKTKSDGTEYRKEKWNKIKKYGCNNRILFSGQRGCGKTSVMRSLADYLSKSNPKPTLVDKDGNEIPTDVMFCCLPMVDPSHFDNNNNILLTVITSMFSEAKKKMNNDKDGGDTDKREGLLKQFEKVFKSLDSIKSELSSYTLESLNRKSDAEDLKDKMKDLVDKYLIFRGCGNSDEARLILLIDDIDMSVSYAPEMLEQLRKYLELDNLIILMSANLGQLSNEMREKYSSAFQYTLKDSNQALSIDVEDLATKYLLKLFPTSRRINVERHVDQLLKTDLVVEEWNDQNKNENQTDSSKIKDDGAQGEGDFQKVILSLIWSKTRLLFIPKDSKNTLHPIIPTNLRDLAQFLDMLTSLEIVGSAYEYKNVEKNNETIQESRLFASKKDYDTCEHNLQVFKNYFMKTWIPNHLKVDEELVFHNIPTDITEINKHLVNSINIIGTNHKDDLMSREVSLDIIERNAENVYIDRDIYTMVSPNDPKFVKANKISDIFNQPSNYSYGDLLLIIDKYETYFESEEHRKFTDAIKIYYSILLFETMFFKSNEVEYILNYFEEKKDSGKDMVIPIQKLIGGNVYYPNYFEIITDKNFNQKGPSYDAKRAFYHKVKVREKDRVGNMYPLFAVLYYGDIRPDRYEKDHIYDTTFEKNANIDGVKYVTFDILSIFNNMLNPCHTLSRLDDVNYQPEDIDWKKIVGNIEDWGKYIKIDGVDSISIPNAILPFYSVDMMLNYLRKDYRVSDIIENETDMESVRNLANDYYFFFNINENREEFIEAIWEKINKNTSSADKLSKNTFEELKSRMLALSEQNKSEHGLLPVMENTLDDLKQAIVFGKSDAELTTIINGLDEMVLKKEDKENLISNIIQLNTFIRNGINKLERIKENKSQKIREVLERMTKAIRNITPVDKMDIIKLEHHLLLSDKTKKEVLSDIASGKRGIINTLQVCDDVKEALKGQANKIATSQYAETLENNIITQNEFTEIDSLLKEYDNGNIFNIKIFHESILPKQTIFTNEDQVNTIVEYLKVIYEAHVCYHKITNSCHVICENKIGSITDFYRNRVIALILGINNQYMSKKDKETLLKEIQKYETVSEVYCHLVEVLWKNSITELCIRGVIQEKVRSIETVQKYYRKLLDRTKTMLSSIDHSGTNTLISIYEKVFDKAEKIFIQ